MSKLFGFGLFQQIQAPSTEDNRPVITQLEGPRTSLPEKNGNGRIQKALLKKGASLSGDGQSVDVITS